MTKMKFDLMKVKIAGFFIIMMAFLARGCFCRIDQKGYK